MAVGDKIENVDVRVEKEAAGYVDVERKQFGAAHPSQEEADTFAKHMSAATDRWTGAAEQVEPDPEKYPGDGAST